MAFSYGLTNPAAFKGESVEETPALFKMYTVVPTRSTESTAANKRRPVLYTSFNGGFGWKYESQTTSNNFYHVNYGGNFYFKGSDGSLTGFAHKSASSSFGAYKARAGLDSAHKIRLDIQEWETSAQPGVPYDTANQPDREICKCPDSNRFFCIRNGGGNFIYNDNAWSTANWNTTLFNSGFMLSDDGGFKHISPNPEAPHEALVYFVTTDSNRYVRLCLCDLSTLTVIKDYTTIVMGSLNCKRTDYTLLSVDYSPYIGGWLVFYNKSGNTRIGRRILYTRDPSTGTAYAQNDYHSGNEHFFGPSGTQLVQYGSHGWYCPWTEEYFLVGSANAVFWTKDGSNWYMSANRTGAATTDACQKFITDGQNMIIATSGSAYYRSYDKGQTWAAGVALSPDGFNTGRSNDTIVLPFKCINNIGIDTTNAVLGEYYTSAGAVGIAPNNFRINDYTPVDPNTSYVFFGRKTTTMPIVRNSRISFYDSNKTFISQTESNSWITTGSGNYTPCIATSPSNAAYARFCCRIDDSTMTQEKIDACEWYFAKEDDFKVMTNYGDIVLT